ncbi:MAG: hypothetical protein KA765_02120 [Thermoflexales bacterium]|nr:hypothetical protein [Thermoflexales bacterium]
MKVEEQFEDVLQNIESGVVSVYHAHPELVDWDVEAAYEALIQYYQAEARQKPAHLRPLAGLQAEVLQAAQAMCEWRLGRAPLHDERDQPVKVKSDPLTATDMVACLKRLRKSVQFWGKAGGRQGYLNYIVNFIL